MSENKKAWEEIISPIYEKFTPESGKLTSIFYDQYKKSAISALSDTNKVIKNSNSLQGLMTALEDFENKLVSKGKPYRTFQIDIDINDFKYVDPLYGEIKTVDGWKPYILISPLLNIKEFSELQNLTIENRELLKIGALSNSISIIPHTIKFSKIEGRQINCEIKLSLTNSDNYPSMTGVTKDHIQKALVIKLTLEVDELLLHVTEDQGIEIIKNELNPSLYDFDSLHLLKKRDKLSKFNEYSVQYIHQNISPEYCHIRNKENGIEKHFLKDSMERKYAIKRHSSDNRTHNAKIFWNLINNFADHTKKSFLTFGMDDVQLFNNICRNHETNYTNINSKMTLKILEESLIRTKNEGDYRIFCDLNNDSKTNICITLLGEQQQCSLSFFLSKEVDEKEQTYITEFIKELRKKSILNISDEQISRVLNKENFSGNGESLVKEIQNMFGQLIIDFNHNFNKEFGGYSNAAIKLLQLIKPYISENEIEKKVKIILPNHLDFENRFWYVLPQKSRIISHIKMQKANSSKLSEIFLENIDSIQESSLNNFNWKGTEQHSHELAQNKIKIWKNYENEDELTLSVVSNIHSSYISRIESLVKRSLVLKQVGISDGPYSLQLYDVVDKE